MRMLCCCVLMLAVAGQSARADGPADNKPDNVRRIPKLGIEVPADQRASLQSGLDTLGEAIAQLAARPDKRHADLLPDVEIFYKAVHDALTYQEFFDAKELRSAESQLTEGLLRAQQLAAGQTPWTAQTGLVVRGYRSHIDGSVQPYGLVVPEGVASSPGRRWRLDLWFHGRGETLSEVNFLEQRRKQVGTFAPADAIVLHPYGRYSNAFKFAGETDVLEALKSVEQRYRIDPDRISVRGFSMGGAACWQFAVHYPDRWFAANPGAGFSETPEFLKVFQDEKLDPPWYERKLWHLYDCPGYAVNLSNCPTIAYSGEIDRQKQAADIMEQALAEEGIDLVHIIGPKTAHSYHPQARVEVESLMAALAEKGRDRTPRHVHLATYTLKYNRQGWVTIDALAEHWQRAQVDGEITQGGKIRLTTENVTALTLEFPTGRYPLDLISPPELSVDDQTIEAPSPRSDRSWNCQLVRDGSTWKVAATASDVLRKRHNLQGPIDDAFMDSFIFVRPTGTPLTAATGKWVDAELTRAIEHWRRHFRGQARVKDDTDITEEDIASANLVLWGDVQSNAWIARINDKLPIRFEGKEIVGGGQRFATSHHAPILIYPSPLNPDRYVVLNSSFTFREYDYLNNARQTPKLPDWAIVDVRTPPDSRWPGKIAAAAFFDEAWQLKSPRK